MGGTSWQIYCDHKRFKIRENSPSPADVIEAIYFSIEAYEKDEPGSWIHLLPKKEVLVAARELVHRAPDLLKRPRLFGVLFSVMDSIDVAGSVPTTACPVLSHIVSSDAPVYASVVAQCRLSIGKANMNQLTTELMGQQSPRGRFVGYQPGL